MFRSYRSTTPNPTTMQAQPRYNTFRLCLCTQSDKLRTGTFSPYVSTTTTAMRTAAHAKTMSALQIVVIVVAFIFISFHFGLVLFYSVPTVCPCVLRCGRLLESNFSHLCLPQGLLAIKNSNKFQPNNSPIDTIF